MSAPDESLKGYPRYKLIQWSATLAMLLLLLAGSLIGQYPPPLGQLGFCAFGIATGAAFARMSHPPGLPLTRLGQIGLIFVAASQVFFQSLVWSESWRVHDSYLGWRLWWISVVAAVGLGWLQVLWRAGASWEGKSGRTTLACTGLLGLSLTWLALRSNPSAAAPPVLQWLLLLLLLGAAGGSLVIIGHWWKNRPRRARPLPRWMRPAIITTGLVALSTVSFYFGRITMPPPSPFDSAHSLLADMNATDLNATLTRDYTHLKKLIKDMDEVRAEAGGLYRGVDTRTGRRDASEFTPEESQQIRNLFIRYMGYRRDLLHLARVHVGFKKISNESQRHRSFLIGYCAASVALEAGLVYVQSYRDNAPLRAKLNEEEPGLLADGQFEVVYHSVTDQHHQELYREFGVFFELHRARWLVESPPGMDFAKLLDPRIRAGQTALENTRLSPVRAWFSRIGRRLQQDAKSPAFEAQKLLAEFMGDTRIVRREPMISIHQVRTEIQPRLQPGDIIIERRNWYLSNAFLPGFWPHCALYVGTREQLEQVGLDYESLDPDARAVHAKLEEKTNHRLVIIEAMSEGVIFTSAEKSMHADYVAVLRPRLTRDQLQQVIKNAFRYHGRPYDFAFDFADESKLVCSELLHYSFGGIHDFPMDTVLGKKVVTPLGIVEQFAEQSKQQTSKLDFDFVLFYNTPPGQSRARPATAEALRHSIKWPKVFNE